jgi:putative ubiquitin-RnfH superfamily antitoxin RatB of RatAB toxin-antitoxin module
VIVTVIYAKPGAQHVLRVELASGGTVGDAIAASGLFDLVPDLARAPLEAGVWNRSAALDTPLRDGDRVEVYRELMVEPKEARRLRAELRRRRRTAGT